MMFIASTDSIVLRPPREHHLNIVLVLIGYHTVCDLDTSYDVAVDSISTFNEKTPPIPTSDITSKLLLNEQEERAEVGYVVGCRMPRWASLSILPGA